MNSKKCKNYKSERGNLVKKWGEDFRVSEIQEKAPGYKVKGTGIYALYKGKRLVYIGLAKKKSIRKRLKDHRRDKGGKWNRFSFYVIKKTKHIKDIETLILRISKPILNKVKGRFRSKDGVK